MCQLMSTTGHKQLSVTFLNFYRRNVSILIVTFLFITYGKLPGSKGKGIQIPLHVTAAFTTHSTNTKMLLIGLVYDNGVKDGNIDDNTDNKDKDKDNKNGDGNRNND